MPDNAFSVAAQTFRHGTNDLIFFCHKSFFRTSFLSFPKLTEPKPRPSFSDDPPDNLIDGNLTLENHIVVEKEKCRTADEENGNDIPTHPLPAERRSHARHHPPDEIHRGVKPDGFYGHSDPAFNLKLQLQSVDQRVQPEKHDKGKGVKKIEPVEHEGDEARPDKGQDVPPPAIFGERDHKGEPREEIPRKQQRGIERPHRQSDCGNRAGHGGKRYFIG